MTTTTNIGDKEIRVIRGKVDSLSIYEITDQELDILEKGSPDSIYLNFSIFLLSIGLSFLLSLLTLNIQSVKLFTLFSIFSVIGLIGGILLLILWNKTKISVSGIVTKIKSRITENNGDSSIDEN